MSTQQVDSVKLRKERRRKRASRVISLLDYIMENHDKVFDYWLEDIDTSAPKVVVQIPYGKKREFLI